MQRLPLVAAALVVIGGLVITTRNLLGVQRLTFPLSIGRRLQTFSPPRVTLP